VTDQMKQFKPFEIIMKFGANPQRLIFYGEGTELEDFEKAKLKEFKEMCKTKGIKIPDTDPEVLRYMQMINFHIDKSYESIITKNNLKNQHFPTDVTQRVFDLI